jgi:arylsulfatase A-like enzyme
VYEGGHRVPFLAALAVGRHRRRRRDDRGSDLLGLLALNDLYATFAEILQVPLPPPTGPSAAPKTASARLAMLRGEAAPERPPLFPNDHKEASQELSDERAWVAVRSNATPIPGQWKLLLDHRYAFHGEIHPQELYDLAEDLRNPQPDRRPRSQTGTRFPHPTSPSRRRRRRFYTKTPRQQQRPLICSGIWVRIPPHILSHLIFT